MRIRSTVRATVLGTFLFTLSTAFASPDALAQTPDDPSVVVQNESMQIVRVYAFEPETDLEASDARVLLGWVGHDDFEHFFVPEEATDAEGDFRIGVQKVTPLPQLGVPAAAQPIHLTPELSPGPLETVRLDVSPTMELVPTLIG